MAVMFMLGIYAKFSMFVLEGRLSGKFFVNVCVDCLDTVLDWWNNPGSVQQLSFLSIVCPPHEHNTRNSGRYHRRPSMPGQQG